MQQNIWQVTNEHGFLMNVAPIPHLSAVESRIPEDVIDHVEGLATELSELLQTGRVRAALDDLPVHDFAHVGDDQIDPRVCERLLLLYSFFANAYVHSTEPTQRIPAGVAAPLVQTAAMVGRPPILSYAQMVLGNWHQLNSELPISLDNITTLQTFLNIADESWFCMVHMTIEAQSAQILQGIATALRGSDIMDDNLVLEGLRDINRGLVNITRTFHQMPQGCDPDIYYKEIRPYMFGFTNVVFEGVPQYGGQPQSLRGGSGAQSSIIPAALAALGVRHEENELMAHMDTMREYMPPPHSEYITTHTTNTIRDYVYQRPPLADAYNACLHQLITFRRAHFYYARTYIFAKSTNPVGTGGTMFMDFLSKLVQETEDHLI